MKFIKQVVRYISKSKSKGWFAQFVETGDVISKENRRAIQRYRTQKEVSRIQRMLDD